MKSNNNLCLWLVLASALAVPFSGHSQTKIEETFNKVSVTDGSKTKSIQTGEESRAQLSNGEGTFRVGANSDLTVGADGKTIDLRQGVMMVNTGNNGLLKRNSVTVETEQIQATSNASMLISYQPHRYIKIACLEGKVTITLKGLSRETVTIRKGQLLIINCLENILPDAITVDMSRLMQTSPLLGPALRGGPGFQGGRLPGNAPPGGAPPGNGPGGNGPGGNGPGAGLPPGAGPPPPQSQNNQPGLPNARQPRPNDLPGRRIDCPSPNDPNCRPNPRPPGGP